MAERLYGFPKDEARIVNRLVRREGLKSRTSTTIRYPKPLADDVLIKVGIPDQDIAKGATDTVSIYNANTEADTDYDVEAKALVEAVEQGLWVTLIFMDGVWLVFPAECA